MSEPIRKPFRVAIYAGTACVVLAVVVSLLGPDRVGGWIDQLLPIILTESD